VAQRHRAGWVAAQLLLGVGLARPAPLAGAAVLACLLLLALVVPVARLTIVALAAVVALVAAVPQSWPLPALLAGAALLAMARARPAHPNGLSFRLWLFWGLGVGLLAAGAVTPLVLRTVDSAPLAFPVQQPPIPVLAALVLGAAVVNASAEELLWRGAIIAADHRCGLGTGTTVAAQAVGFGIAHLHGLPGGPVGVLAAGLFGAAMAWLRLRAGLRVALVAHVLADVAIFSIVAATAVFIPG
jgi:membrane protease YdiL (CAAX protease family)